MIMLLVYIIIGLAAGWGILLIGLVLLANGLEALNNFTNKGDK